MNILKDPRNYVKRYLETQKIQVNERGEMQHSSKKNNLELFDTLFLDYSEQVRAHNAFEVEKAQKSRDVVSPIKREVLQIALNEFITEKKIEYRKQVIAHLTCENEDLTQVKLFVKALKGYEDEIDVAVLAHWLWQVKVKMNGKDPTYHIMPIFYGKQKGGKTVALERLIEPLNNFRLNISMDQMTDDRYYKAMADNYVIVFDEMEGAQRTDIDALKKQITIRENDYRPMRTNDVFKVRQNCSFIGATNRPVAEQIVDSTGMRRFWQLDCMDKLDWSLMETIDFLAMWKGINENKKEGYSLDKIDEIDAKQQEMVAKDQIISYMDDRGIVAGKEPTKEVSTADLYRDYKQWAAENGVKILDSNWFGRKLAGKNIKKITKKVAGKTTNLFLIPETVVLFNNDFTWDSTSILKSVNQ